MNVPVLVPLSARRLSEDKAWSSVVAPVVVGKDMLELLSTSMYVNPMSIYREYIQNAADAIDQAREVGLIPKVGQGRVDLFIDVPTRTVRIRDDGGD